MYKKYLVSLFIIAPAYLFAADPSSVNKNLDIKERGDILCGGESIGYVRRQRAYGFIRPALFVQETQGEDEACAKKLTREVVLQILHTAKGNMVLKRPRQLGNEDQDYAKSLAKLLEHEEGFYGLEIGIINHVTCSNDIINFANSFACYGQLKKLIISGDVLTREAVCKLVEVLKVHSVIEEFDFSFGKSDFNCAVILADIFGTNRSLKNICLMGNLGDRGLGALLSGLQRNEILEFINIRSTSKIEEDYEYYNKIYIFDKIKAVFRVTSFDIDQDIQWVFPKEKSKNIFRGIL